jgi:hypothetical protein
MTPGTNPLADTKCQGNRRVISEAPVFLKETFRSEFLWIWVYLWIVQDCPATSPINVQILVDNGGCVPCIGYQYRSCWVGSDKSTRWSTDKDRAGN